MSDPIERDPAVPPTGMPEVGTPTDRRARFTIPDFLIVFGLGIAGGLVASFGVAAATGELKPSAAATFGIIFPGQVAATLLGLLRVRAKRGYPSLRAAFGLSFLARDLRWIFLGVGLNIGLILLFIPIVKLIEAKEPAQGIVQLMTGVANPLTIVLAGVALLVLAPLTEEMTYRGLLLRLVRQRAGKNTAIVVSAVVFGLIHLLGITDFSAETFRTALVVAVPQFTVVGVVLALLTVRHERLGPAMATHAGYNALSFVALLVVPGIAG